MNPKYAIFIWGSYALMLAVVAWNLVVPVLRRIELRRSLRLDVAGELESLS